MVVGMAGSDSEMAATFEYRPVDSSRREIRLLNLSPSDSFEARLNGELQHSYLENAPPYEALSYIWGSPIFDHTVVIGDRVLRITRNLDHALRHIRLKDAPRRLWIDGACINQGDIVERSQQVPLMHDIYSSCTCVLAWLGPFVLWEQGHRGEDSDKGGVEDVSWSHDAAIAAGMEVFERLARRDRATLHKMGPYSYLSEELDAGKDPQGPYAFSEGDRYWLSSLFRFNKIWSRVWIVQELVCAQNVRLVCASASLDWAVISSFLADDDGQYADAFHMAMSHSTEEVMRSMFNNPKRIEQQRRAFRRSKLSSTSGSEENGDRHDGDGYASDDEPRWLSMLHSERFRYEEDEANRRKHGSSSLLDVLARFRHASATDPRDMAYGLLGLVTEPHSLGVDYTRSTVQVFADASVAIINSRRDLDVLCQNPWAYYDISAERQTAGLPSWVADLANDSGARQRELLLFAQRGIFAAGRSGCGSPCQTLHGGMALKVRGVVVGQIGAVPNGHVRDMSVREEEDPVGRSPRSLAALFSLREKLLSPTTTYPATGEPLMRAFCRTLSADCKAYPIIRLSADEIEHDTGLLQSFLADDEGQESEDLPTGRVFAPDLVLLGAMPARHEGQELENISNDSAVTPDTEVQEDQALYHEAEVSYDESGSLEERYWLEHELLEDLHSLDMMGRNYSQWVFLTTADGLFVLTRNGVLEGDHLVVLDGGKVPVVLRKTESRFTEDPCYEFLCPAYVHGYMDGEVLKRVDEGIFREDDFLLV